MIPNRHWRVRRPLRSVLWCTEAIPPSTRRPCGVRRIADANCSRGACGPTIEYQVSCKNILQRQGRPPPPGSAGADPGGGEHSERMTGRRSASNSTTLTSLPRWRWSDQSLNDDASSCRDTSSFPCDTPRWPDQTADKRRFCHARQPSSRAVPWWAVVLWFAPVRPQMQCPLPKGVRPRMRAAFRECDGYVERRSWTLLLPRVGRLTAMVGLLNLELRHRPCAPPGSVWDRVRD